MAPQVEKDDLLAAWRALGGSKDAEGWRTIPVALDGPCRVFAGRHFPGNEEALLIAFTSAHIPLADQLPQGRGFLVSRADIGTKSSCIALCRESAGNLSLFAMMALDIVATLSQTSGDEERVLQVFLSRIRAWQEFMRRGSDSVLSAEAEIGLYGELVLLESLVLAGVSSIVAVDAWQGPLGRVHDFVFGTGAIEVKTTASQIGFPATIGSLEQLDDALLYPLYLAGVRLVLIDSGTTLTGKIDELRTLVADDYSALERFNTRLLHAGFLDQFADRYSRRFSVAGIRLLTIDQQFPRLIRPTVPTAVLQARYDIDLDVIPSADAALADALVHLGAV